MAEKKFGRDTYRCDKLDAEQGLRLLVRTTKILGPASGVISALSESNEAKADAMSIQAIGDFVAKLDEEGTVSFVKELIGHCRCNGEPAVFGVTPQDLGEALQIAFWVLEVQFRDFLGGALAAAKRRPLAAR